MIKHVESATHTLEQNGVFSKKLFDAIIKYRNQYRISHHTASR